MAPPCLWRISTRSLTRSSTSPATPMPQVRGPGEASFSATSRVGQDRVLPGAVQQGSGRRVPPDHRLGGPHRNRCVSRPRVGWTKDSSDAIPTKPAPRAGPSVTQRLVVGRINRQIANAQGMTTVTRDFTLNSQVTSSITIDPDSVHTILVHLRRTWAGGTTSGCLPDVLPDSHNGWPNSPGTPGRSTFLSCWTTNRIMPRSTEETDPTAINDAIRGILAQFSKSSYIAFTATPFANIFIDYANTDDLFPRDFIYSLESPSNYVGARATFGPSLEKNPRPNLRQTEQHRGLPAPQTQVRFPGRPTFPTALSRPSEHSSSRMRYRDLRKQNEARSMLVNVSRFKRVQRQVFELVEAEVAVECAIELSLPLLHARGERNEELTELERTYRSLYLDCGFDWDTVLSALESAVSDIRVEAQLVDRDRQLAEEQVASIARTRHSPSVATFSAARWSDPRRPEHQLLLPPHTGVGHAVADGPLVRVRDRYHDLCGSGSIPPLPTTTGSSRTRWASCATCGRCSTRTSPKNSASPSGNTPVRSSSRRRTR